MDLFHKYKIFIFDIAIIFDVAFFMRKSIILSHLILQAYEFQVCDVGNGKRKRYLANFDLNLY